MNVIPVTPITLELARRVIWFEPPEQALSDPIRFMAYAMTYALHEDMREIRRYLSDDDIREALDHAPAGIIDARSWAYWNARMGRYPAPLRPVRMFVTSSRSKDCKPPRQPPVVRPKSEEVRRKAREEWRDKYGDRK